uniref:Uncharacterized protein n=1 Tax=Cacopsylla melanoneura TaxID=428564 RepID=A0A8D8M2L7_9HEMI
MTSSHITPCFKFIFLLKNILSSPDSSSSSNECLVVESSAIGNQMLTFILYRVAHLPIFLLKNIPSSPDSSSSKECLVMESSGIGNQMFFLTFILFRILVGE